MDGMPGLMQSRNGLPGVGAGAGLSLSRRPDFRLKLTFFARKGFQATDFAAARRPGVHFQKCA
jgi:hypothetical protein